MTIHRACGEDLTWKEVIDMMPDCSTRTHMEPYCWHCGVNVYNNDIFMGDSNDYRKYKESNTNGKFGSVHLLANIY